MRRLLPLALLAGCYAPTPPAGSPCATAPCPSPLVCSTATQTCERTALDAAPPRADGPRADAALVTDGAIVDAVVSRYRAAVLADHPIGYFRLDEPVGAAAFVDTVRPDRQATLSGGVTLATPGALAGDADTAARFDGATGRAALQDGTFAFDKLVPFSVEAWLWIDPAFPRNPGGNALRVGTPLQTGYVIAWNSGGLAFLGYDATSQTTSVGIANPPLGTYVHYVVTYDGTTGRAYLDGALQNSRPMTIGSSLGGPSQIGANPSGNFWQGGIDELAVYDYVLTADQIASHHAAGI